MRTLGVAFVAAGALLLYWVWGGKRAPGPTPRTPISGFAPGSGVGTQDSGGGGGGGSW